ncbi:MAG: Flp family type IVb pilin [Bryobacteraceae bacterium]|jgi:Flp pilus assembly pilin Flp
MKTAINLTWKLRIWTDSHGQDLIEYALMAAVLAVSAGAVVLSMTSGINKIFSMVSDVMTAAS